MSLAERVRRAIPDGALPAVVGARARWALRKPGTRERARAHMDLLVGAARPDADLDREVRDFVRFELLRPELHRRPGLLFDQEVLDTQHLVDATSLGRGVVLHFLHHGLYEGTVTSMGRQGLVHNAIVEPELLRDDLTGSRRAYAELIRVHVDVRSTEIGIGGMVGLLREGRVLAMATDRPGRTPVSFCERTLYSSSGACRIAIEADAPVVPIVGERTPSGRIVGRVLPVVEPSAHASPDALLQHLVSLHEPYVLAWPAAYVYPLDCWGTEPPAPRATS